jgi:hypothetical protein
MKIKTITFHSVLNYGAIIQAYALIKFLEINEHDAELIDYQPMYFRKQVFRPAKGIRKSYNKYKRLIRFYKFRKKHIRITSDKYYNIRALNNIDCDVLICGSDQIWNKKFTGGKPDKAFYLDFGHAKIKRIAYAASCGHGKIGSEEIALIKKLDVVLVREKSLEDEIKNNYPSISNVKTVVDPCLLIDDYTALFDDRRVPKTAYILSYVVGSEETINRSEQTLTQLKKLINLPIYHIGSNESNIADYNLLDLSPEEWLSFFHGATFIATTSFHGVAMSINFLKNFISIPHSIDSLNERQLTLLENCGLAYKHGYTMDIISNTVQEIETYSTEIQERIKTLKEHSKKLLLDSLKK